MSSAPSNPNAMDEAMEGHAETLLSGNPGFWLGPQLVGAFVDALLCGIMIMQFVQWVSFSQADRLYTKVAVYGSFTAGIAGTIYSMWCAIHVYVYGFGVGVNFLSSSYISNLLIPDSITALLVQVHLPTRDFVEPATLSEQTFFAERAYRLIGNSKVFLGIAGALILFSFGSSIALLVEMKLLTSITQMPSLRTVGYTWNWVEWDGTTIEALVTISLETQLPPTILAFGLMITHVLYSSSTLSTGFIMVISKAYICGLLGALLSRYHLRRDGYSNGSKVSSATRLTSFSSPAPAYNTPYLFGPMIAGTPLTPQNTFKGARSGGPTQDTIHVATETYVSTGRPVRPVTTNRASSYGDNQQQHTEGHGKNAYERSEMKRSSAAKSDYGDYESTKVLTA